VQLTYFLRNFSRVAPCAVTVVEIKITAEWHRRCTSCTWRQYHLFNW